MRISITCLLIIGLYGGITAQTRTDSLLRVWQNTTLNDSLRFQAADVLCTAIAREYPDSAYHLAQAVFNLAQKKHNKLAQAKALNHIGLSWRLRSDFSKAIQAYEQSIELFESLDDKANLADTYRNIGDVYRLQSNFSKAIDNIQRSLALAESIGDQVKIADAYVCLSTIYYMSSNNLEQMESYLLKAKPLYEASQLADGLVFVYSNLSLVEYERNRYPSALEYVQKSIAIQEKNGDLFGLATSLQNRATLYIELGRYAEAQADFEKEITIFEKIGDQEGLSDAYSSLGGLYLQQKKPSAAISWCLKALQSAEVLGVGNLSAQNACQCLADAYEQQGNYRVALEYLRRFNTIKDSLQNQKTEQRLKQMEIERDSLSIAKTTLEKKQAFELTLRQKNRIVGILASFVVLGILVALAFWTRMLYFKRRSLDMQIRSEVMEKQQLISEIALLRTQVNPHFLFNSLSILSSLVHKDADLSEQFIEQLARSYRYILEQKDQALVTLRTELEFIQSYAYLLKIRFDHKFDLDIDIANDALDRYQIAPLTLQLLVENAVKHNRMSSKEPLIVRVSVQANVLEVRNTIRLRGELIHSTGIGLQNIINRYALLSEQAVWAGEQEGDFVVRVPLV